MRSRKHHAAWQWSCGRTREWQKVVCSPDKPLHLQAEKASHGVRIESSQRKLTPAKGIHIGDTITVLSGSGGEVQSRMVTHRRASKSHVRYVIIESGSNIVASDAMVSVYSTPLGFVETLPFLVMDYVWPGVLQFAPVAAALYDVLESPALRGFEKATSLLTSRR